ncbi:ABC transporter permease [Oscillospiraceae bacterium CM]|nr:ABC transporter permease [Oscillospiraceae bacterium CM]
MGRFFRCDLKRIFTSRATVILCLVVPLVVMLLFASVLAPLLVTRARVSVSCFVICNDDGTDPSVKFIDYVANSKAFKGVVTISSVKTLDEGLSLIDADKVSGMLYIPSHFYDDLSAGKSVQLQIYGNTYHTLECALVLTAVETALNTVGRAQNALGAVRDYALSVGADAGQTDAFYNRLLDLGISVVTNRKAVLGQTGFVSAAGDYLPAELCLSAMLTWFLSLAMLPLTAFSAADFSESVLQRVVRSRGMRRKFLLARLFSGALFLLIVAFLVFPVGIGASSLTRLFSGNLLALFGAMGLLALTFSALSLSLSAWIPNRDTAVWIGFWLIVAFAAVGGAILPESMLPRWAAAVGQWSPLRAAVRLLGSTIFKFDSAAYPFDMLKTALWCLFGLAGAFTGFLRRSSV